MIVDPDFLDHWKTRLLVDLLGGDEMAPMYVIRLWAHCQQRRMYRFDNLTNAALRAICRYTGDADFASAMTQSGFVSRDENGVLEACSWDEYNATLIANWNNGKRGGRPRKEALTQQKEPIDNPSETHGLPMANPSLTHGEPIRLDKIGEDKYPPNPPSADADEGVKPARRRKIRTTLKAFVAECNSRCEKPISNYQPLLTYVQDTGLPMEFVQLCWNVFKDEFLSGGGKESRMQADWRLHFLNYVKKGYYRLWFARPDGTYDLTTAGIQAKTVYERRAA